MKLTTSKHKNVLNTIISNDDENDNMKIVEVHTPKMSSSYPIRLQLLSQVNRNNCIVPLRDSNNSMHWKT